jgi:hypothetical protein
MITMESGVSLMVGNVVSSRLRWIIGVALALLLAGCSALRIGYSQAPTLAYWWIDGYVDVNGEQTPLLRNAIDRWFDWHRRDELPQYAVLLARAQREALEPQLTAQSMCAWRDVVQARLDAALEQATPALATLLLSLTPEQIRHIERKLAKDGVTMRADFAQADRGERAKAALKRTLERFEGFYGRLDEAQRERLAQLLAISSFDPERWLAERERRNRDLVQTLTQVTKDARGLDSAGAQSLALSTVRTLVERAQRSPRADYRAYQERLAQENCALTATMHNLMTPAQRRNARDKLKGWEDDLRAIAGATTADAGR